MSLNSTGSLTLAPAPTAYTKPLMVMVDEFSASGADMFPAIIQDNHRGPIFGTRTMGAGGAWSDTTRPRTPRASSGSRCR